MGTLKSQIEEREEREKREEREEREKNEKEKGFGCVFVVFFSEV